MSIGLIGRKLGMTRVFNENGKSVPVTVIQVEANRVTQLKNLENDGYTAIQVTTGERKASRRPRQKLVTSQSPVFKQAVAYGSFV